jgi:hypothetical protein
MRIGLDGGPIGGLLKMSDDALGLLDLAAEYGFEGALLSDHVLRDDEAHTSELRDKVVARQRG